MYPGLPLGTIKGEARERPRHDINHATLHSHAVEFPYYASLHTTLVFTPVQALRCKITQTPSPTGRRAFSCPNQDKSLCLFHHHKGKHAYKFTRWCDPPWEKHRQLSRQVGVLRVFHRFPILFQMATLSSPIPRSTVIWFGSLEFKSTGSGYDMILLSIKGPGGARVALTRMRAPRRPHHHAPRPRRGVDSTIIARLPRHDRQSVPGRRRHESR